MQLVQCSLPNNSSESRSEALAKDFTPKSHTVQALAQLDCSDQTWQKEANLRMNARRKRLECPSRSSCERWYSQNQASAQMPSIFCVPILASQKHCLRVIKGDSEFHIEGHM